MHACIRSYLYFQLIQRYMHGQYKILVYFIYIYSLAGTLIKSNNNNNHADSKCII